MVWVSVTDYTLGIPLMCNFCLCEAFFKGVLSIVKGLKM